MGWAGQTWIRITQEGTGGSNYGVYDGAADPSEILYPTIYGGDAFTARLVPQRQLIRTADAGNRRKMVVANRKVVVGRFNTLIHPDQAAFWAEAIGTLTSNYLPSYTFDYWDSIQAWRLLGGVCRSATLAFSAEQDYGTLSTEWVFQKRDATFTTFAQPAESNYSTLVPYVHVESASNITLGGTAITKYKNCSVTVNNVLAGTWDELAYISALYYCGRDLDFQIGPQYLATTLRGDFESQSALTFVLEWSRSSPAHSLQIDCQTNSYISNIEDQLPLDGPGYQNIGVQAFFDAASSTDFAITAS